MVGLLLLMPEREDKMYIYRYYFMFLYKCRVIDYSKVDYGSFKHTFYS